MSNARTHDRRRFLRDAALTAAGIAGATTRPSAGTLAWLAQEPSARRTVPPASLSRQFARWVVGLRFEDLPAAVVDRAKGLTLQNLASALLGSGMPAGQQAARFVADEEAGVPGGATVLVTGTKVTRGGAAFANAEMMLAGGKWDTFRMLTHPGTAIIPSALVASEGEGASGRDFITGIVAGYEVMERMAADWIPTVMARGFHAGPVFSIFGAAIAAAKILHLNEDQVHGVISLCTNLAGSNLESRALREGAAVRNAMLAVALAKQGPVGGGEAVLEGPAGFYRAYAGNNHGDLSYAFTGPLKASFDEIVAGLGQRWEVLDVKFKIYPTPGFNQPVIWLASQMVSQHRLVPAAIERVTLEMNYLETLYPTPRFPRANAADGSPFGRTAYMLAYTVVAGDYPVLEDYNPHTVAEGSHATLAASVGALQQRVEIIGEVGRDCFAPRMTFLLKDGRRITGEYHGRELMWDFARDAQELRRFIPGLPVPAPQYDHLVAVIASLDSADSVNDLVGLTLRKAS